MDASAPRQRPPHAAVLSLALLCFLFLMGNRPDCDDRQPNLTCVANIPYTVQPGTCVEITNPCSADGSWAQIDGFRLCDEPPGLFIRGFFRDGPRRRELCATLGVATLLNEPVVYTYGSRNGDLGEGQFLVYTASAPSVAVSADPMTIDPGESSQLGSTVTGGAPPYTYSWSPAGSLDFSDIPSPIATPAATTTYTLTVTGADGFAGLQSVTVTVQGTLQVTATPPVIDPGESSQLLATVAGEVGSPTYSWVPSSTVNDNDLMDPVATPPNTTTYQVTVVDDIGQVLQGTVTVTVNLVLPSTDVTATPPIIDFGDSSQLLALPAGGTPPYSYEWCEGQAPPCAPPPSLDDSTVADPVATPDGTTVYSVVVTDAAGTTVGPVNVGVIVNPPPDQLVACFTYTPDPIVEDAVTSFDASCSSAPIGRSIVEYRWWFDFVDPNFPPNRLLPDPTTTFVFEVPRTIDVRLLVTDDQGNQSESIQTVTVEPAGP